MPKSQKRVSKFAIFQNFQISYSCKDFLRKMSTYLYDELVILKNWFSEKLNFHDPELSSTYAWNFLKILLDFLKILLDFLKILLDFFRLFTTLHSLLQLSNILRQDIFKDTSYITSILLHCRDLKFCWIKPK